MASAVAAPIPRLAPVITTTRPASQCPWSLIDRGPSTLADDPLVEPLVSVQTTVQVEMARRMLAALRARDTRGHPDGAGGRPDVAGRDQETGHMIHDHLTQPAALERDDWSPARLGLRGGHPAGFVPLCRAD